LGGALLQHGPLEVYLAKWDPTKSIWQNMGWRGMISSNARLLNGIIAWVEAQDTDLEPQFRVALTSSGLKMHSCLSLITPDVATYWILVEQEMNRRSHKN